MTETLIRVQVAPGETVLITPHPSGLAELGALYIRAGEHVSVMKARADELYAAGKILHPVSGQPRPTQAFTPPPLVSRSVETFESLAAQAELERNNTPKSTPRAVELDSWARGHRQYEARDPATTEEHVSIDDGTRHQW